MDERTSSLTLSSLLSSWARLNPSILIVSGFAFAKYMAFNMYISIMII